MHLRDLSCILALQAFAASAGRVSDNSQTHAGIFCLPIIWKGSNNGTISISTHVASSNCSWIIPRPKIGYYTHLQVVDYSLDVESTAKCYINYLSISVDSNKDQYCGSGWTTKKRIASNNIFIDLILTAYIKQTELKINFNYIKADTINWNGNMYYLSEYEMSWSEAKDFCYKIWGEGNGDLAIINNADENNFLFAKSIQKHINNAYIGGSVKSEQGKWIWNDNCPFEHGYTNWEDKKHNSKQTCLHFGDSHGKWKYVDCELSFPFLCEKKRSDSICGLEYKWNGNEYYVSKYNWDTRTWFEARQVCDEHWGKGKGDLAIINDAAENEKLYQIAEENGLNNAYIGGSDIIEKGKWIWTDNCPFEYRTNLLGSDTDNEENEKHCLQFGRSVNTWSAVLCDTKLSFVCEKKKSGVSCVQNNNKNDTEANIQVGLVASAIGNFLLIIFIVADSYYICFLLRRNKQIEVKMRRNELSCKMESNNLYTLKEQRQLPSTPAFHNEVDNSINEKSNEQYDMIYSLMSPYERISDPISNFENTDFVNEDLHYLVMRG